RSRGSRFSRPWPGSRPWRRESSSPPTRRLWLPIAGTAPPGGRSAPIWSSRARLPLAFVVELGLKQRAEIGGSGTGPGILRTHALHRLGFIGMILRLDREIDRPVLAIDVDDHGGHRIALLQMRADVLDPVARDIRRAQVTFDVAIEADDRTLAVERLDRAGDHIALVVGCDVVRERVAIELLDAERDALAFDVDRQHHGLDFLALAIVAHRGFARQRPGQIRQVNQTVNRARQADEHAEVGDRLDQPLHLVALLVIDGELLPRIGHALLHAQRDAPAFLVDFQNHDLDLVAQLDDLGRMDVLVRPVHFGDVDKTLDALLDLDERAVIGD